MSTFWRTVWISAAVTGTAALVWHYLSAWSERAVQTGEGVAGAHAARSQEEVIDELSDDEKQRMLQELGEHL